MKILNQPIRDILLNYVIDKFLAYKAPDTTGLEVYAKLVEGDRTWLGQRVVFKFGCREKPSVRVVEEIDTAVLTLFTSVVVPVLEDVKGHLVDLATRGSLDALDFNRLNLVAYAWDFVPATQDDPKTVSRISENRLPRPDLIEWDKLKYFRVIHNIYGGIQEFVSEEVLRDFLSKLILDPVGMSTQEMMLAANYTLVGAKPRDTEAIYTVVPSDISKFAVLTLNADGYVLEPPDSVFGWVDVPSLLNHLERFTVDDKLTTYYLRPGTEYLLFKNFAQTYIPVEGGTNND